MHLESMSLRLDERGLFILDQSRLPMEEVWLDASSPEVMIEHIRALRVRGAPLIGVAAALCVAWAARPPRNASRDALIRAVDALGEARPTAVNLKWAMARMRAVIDASDYSPDLLFREARRIFLEDVELCDRIAAHGLEIVSDGDGILTHCNTGGLATAGIGTALGIIRRAWEKDVRLHVFVDETRPLLQGARLTTWELGHLEIPHTLLTEGMAAVLMAEGRVGKVIVGADRIAANGDVANKVGTYGLAVLAAHHSIPFYVAAPRSTLDLSCPTGMDIPIENRPPDEVRGGPGSNLWAPPGVPVFNPAFDVTPAHLIEALILDSGRIAPGDLHRLGEREEGSGVLEGPRS